MIVKFVRRMVLIAGLLAGHALAEDIDIFAGTTETNTSLPNVIFILDNSANWSRQAQDWPGGLTQGQSEVRALKTVLSSQVGQLNVGLMEYETGSGGADAGYVRFNLQEMDQTAYNEFAGIMDDIFDGINSPIEKRNQSNKYADLPRDFYNYLVGREQSNSGNQTPGSVADAEAYQEQWNLFRSPIEQADVCADTYLVWIGNNRQGGDYSDTSDNSDALKALYTERGLDIPYALAGDGGDPLPVPEFTTVLDTQEVCVDETARYEADELFLGCGRERDVCPGDPSSDGSCPPGATCRCDDRGSCGNGNRNNYYLAWDAYTVEAGSCETIVTSTVQATGDFDDSVGSPYNFDDWSKFLYDHGIPVEVTVTEGEGDDAVETTSIEHAKVTTYAIDVFNAQQQADLSSVWFSAAANGGGRYFQARSEQQLVDALTITLRDILAKSSSFAAVTLPLSTTNRAQVDNEVYIGMFRPYPDKKPRWYGNLKRYQLALFGGVAKLADVRFREAVNPLTNFPEDCARSFWTADTDDYWSNLGVQPSLEGQCGEDGIEPWSDLPDGPFVEKGGVGQQLRWSSSPTLYTVKSGAIAEVESGDATSFGGSNILNYLRGTVPGIGETKPDETLRPSVHGDVVHSRPLSLRIDENNVVMFYGSNDGLYRAVDTYTGNVLWSFVAPEHMSNVERLYDNDPLILYEGADQDDSLNYERKDYFFDGPTGQFVTYAEPDDPDSEALGDLETAMIFPTMRRGGRMVYALDVLDPNAPELLWRRGCETDDTSSCTAGGQFNNIGQTWSTPIGGYLKEYVNLSDEPKPVVMFGGGFDECLNADQAAYPADCANANGKGVYLLDAVSGDLIEYFPTDAPVLTEVTDVDFDFDGTIDYVYVADVKGNLYRITFADLVQDISTFVDVPDSALVARDNSDGNEWEIEKIGTIPAEADGTQKRFYNSPAVGFFRGIVFVAIGSGDRERPLEANYPWQEDVQNNFYVLIDRPYSDYAARQLAEAESEAYTKVPVDLEGDTMHDLNTEFEEGESLVDFDGWYLGLPDQGEQVVNAATIGGGKVFFNTFQPGGVSNGVCQEPLGIGTAYTVDLFAPEATAGEEIAGGGMPIPPILATVEIPPGCETADCVPPCEGPDCDPCSLPGAECETQTVVIGLKGFDPVKIDPDVDPVRQRVYFTEEIDSASD